MAMAVLGSDDAPTDSEESAVSEPAAPTYSGKTREKSGREPTGPTDLSKDENGFFPGLYGYTHKQIADRFATFTAVADIVDLHYKTEQSRKLWLANEVAEGNLIERDRVVAHALGMFDAAFKKLLSDATKTMALRGMSMMKSGCTAEELEQFFREAQGSVLRPARDAAVRALRKQKKPREAEPSSNDEQ